MKGMATKSTAVERARAAAEPGMLVLLCLAAWAIPGAGHFLLGRRQKAVVFFLALSLMFFVGLQLLIAGVVWIMLGLFARSSHGGAAPIEATA